jgi:hypothetical protein
MKENIPSIYKPEFIPFYPDIKKKYNLTDKEALLYGFIRFYISTSPDKKFYFSNKQLGEILDLKEIAVSRLVNSLAEKCNEIKLIYEIKAKGGKIRLIQWYKSDLYENISPTYTKIYENDNKINNNKTNIFLSNDKNGLTTKKQFGNGEVNLILEKFKQLKGFYPTDKDPRRRAWNIVQQINTFLKKNPILIEKYGFTFEKMIDKFFNILKSKDYWDYIENLDTCRRKLNVFFGALEKKIKTLETMKIVEKSLEKQNEYIENKRKEENIAEIPHIKEEIDEMRRKLAEKFKIE